MKTRRWTTTFSDLGTGLAGFLLLWSGSLTGGARDSVESEAVPSRGFVVCDVFIDSKNAPLAAWQFEVTSAAGDPILVGVENGEHEAFPRAPYYDPKALRGGRVVVADYTSADAPPRGRTRVATLHYMVGGDEAPRFEAKLIVAGSPDAEALNASIDIVERK